MRMTIMFRKRKMAELVNLQICSWSCHGSHVGLAKSTTDPPKSIPYVRGIDGSRARLSVTIRGSGSLGAIFRFRIGKSFVVI